MKRYAKGDPLYAEDMNAMAAALDELMAAGRGNGPGASGHAKYGMAWYTPDGSSTASSTDGVLTAAGLIASVDFNAEARAPRIDNGGIQLPFAEYASGTDAHAGVIAGIRYGSGIDAPRIRAGVIELVPGGGGGGGCSCVLAQYQASGAADVPGKIAGVEFSEEVDACRIENGMMRLPMAEYMPATGSSTDEVVVPGAIQRVAYCSAIDEPRIVAGGRMELPTGLVGVMTQEGERATWYGLPSTAASGLILSTHYVGSYKYDLRAWCDGKYLGLAIIQDYNFNSV